MENVSVVIKGTNIGTITDANGNFSLNTNKSSGNILVFSSVGYLEMEITQSGGNTINAQLDKSSQSLDAVVVVGYGTQRKKDVTGAVAQVKATRLENENPASVQDVLRGNVAGLNVTTAVDAKGGGYSGVIIRDVAEDLYRR